MNVFVGKIKKNEFTKRTIILYLRQLENNRRSESTYLLPKYHNILEMSYIGQSPYYYGDSGEDLQMFAERLDIFFELNDIVEEKKGIVLLSCITDIPYKTLRVMCEPQLPKEKPYDELLEMLNKQHSAKTSVFRARYKFYNEDPQDYESISQWYGNVKMMAVECKFGDFFGANVLDRFISGLKPSPILDRLCEEDEETLTMERAFEIAFQMESSINETNFAKEKEKEKESGIAKKEKKRKHKKGGMNKDNASQIDKE